MGEDKGVIEQKLMCVALCVPDEAELLSIFLGPLDSDKPWSPYQDQVAESRETAASAWCHQRAP